jgi:signal transduction histidine kinase
MNFQVKQRLSLLTFLIVFSTLFSCKEIKKDKDSEDTFVTIQTKDTLTPWINGSLDRSLTTSEQKTILSKAYQAVKNLPDDSIKMNYLSQLSYNSTSIDDSLFFRDINQQTFILATQLKDSITLADSKWDLGIYFNDINQKDSTYYYYNQALTIYTKLNKPEKVARLLYNIGAIQREIGDYSGAEASSIKSIEIFKDLDDKKWLAMSYNSLGAITTSLGNHKQAIDFYHTATNYLENVPNSASFKTEIINNIGVSYRELGNFKKAEENFKKVLATDSLELKEPSFYAKTLTNLANSKLDQESKEDLSPLFLEAISLQKKINNPFSEATSIAFFANYLAYKKDSTAAINYAQKAILLARKFENTQSLLRSLDLSTRIDPKNATGYAQEYFALNTKLQQEERQLRDKFARVRFQTDEFIEKNELLAKQNELLKKEKQLWIALAAVGFIGALAILIIVIQRRKNKNLRFKQTQQEANREIFNLLIDQQAKIAAVKKEEQDRISKELHDGVVADMTGIRLVLISLNAKADNSAVAYRAELLKELENVTEEIRSVSHNLYHAASQKMYNFVESVKDLIEKFKAASPTIDYQFIYQKSFDWDAIENDIKINLYRILQESIQNSIKHANANSIFINFEVLENTIITTIEDDGLGFDTQKSKKGIGVKNITSRVKQLNGDWEIHSTQGKGTKIVIKVPLEKPNETAT